MKHLCLAMLLVLSVATWASADAPWISTTGTVVSNSDGVMVVKTSTGDLRFDLDKTTEGPTNAAVGSRVTVWYDSDDKPEDKMDARRIAMAPAPTPTPTPAPTPVVTQQPVTPVVTPEPVTPVAHHEELPQTAGPLPLIGGLGALSLACGALLKKFTARS